MAAQLAWPLRLDHTGRLATVDRDSLEGAAQAVRLTLLTSPGERIVSYDFGTPDPSWAGLDEQELRDAVRRWVPRARIAVTVDQVGGDGVQPARVTVIGTTTGVR